MKLPLLCWKKAYLRPQLFHALSLGEFTATGVVEGSREIEQVPFNELRALSEEEHEMFKALKPENRSSAFYKMYGEGTDAANRYAEIFHSNS